MPYRERPDVAAFGSNAINAAVYGPDMIAEVQETFGVQKQPIYIYNVSQREFNVPRPPNHPHLLIRACPQGQDFALVGQIEHPFTERDYDQNGNMMVRLVDGYREATRMLNPMNPGIDQNWDAPDAFIVGGNLNKYGVFWSTYAPEDERLLPEVAIARQRMEETYRKELERMSAIEAKSPDDARAAANDISHAAANYFGISTSWHRSDLIPKTQDNGKIECWACGEKIQPAALICIHCRAPQEESRREKWLEAQTAPTYDGASGGRESLRRKTA